MQDIKTLERFGKFRIIKLIANGGMAEVFLAETERMSGICRRCALKRIREPFGNDRSFVSRFIDEARITIGLEHPNIVELYDFGQVDGHYFIAMEYVQGQDLAQILRRVIEEGRSLSVGFAAYLAARLLRGLHYAHSAKDDKGDSLQIVHRDVSPQNVLIAHDGRVKLTDFGVANARNKITVTTPGMVVGKSAYMSPEQAKAKETDGRTDIWATGVLMHEMLAGQRLFSRANTSDTLTAVLRHKVEKPSELRTGIPECIDDIVLKALDRNVNERFESAALMSAALDEFLADIGYSDEDFKADLLRETPFQVLPVADDDATVQLVGAGLLETVEGNDAEIIAKVEQMRRRPDVWTLVEIGKLMHTKHPARALASFRCAAAVFAYRGNLVQAAAAHAHARDLLRPDDAEKDLVLLAELTPGKRSELDALITRLECREIWELLCTVDPNRLGNPRYEVPSSDRTPLLSDLEPNDFADVAMRVIVRSFAPGDVLMREGDTGDFVCALANGQVVVYCKPSELDVEDWAVRDINDASDVGYAPTMAMNALQSAPGEDAERSYLSALAAGDFFGEFSFLTDRPRSATVQSITQGVLIELPRDVLEGADEVAMKTPLKRFYRERVVELMMAKNPVFSSLSPHERNRLLERVETVSYHDEAMIVRKGEASDCLYFIRKGEVEVFEESELGLPVFINKLVQGQFFGEIGAVKGTARANGVRAMGTVVLYRIAREHLLSIMESRPEVSKRLQLLIAGRTQQTQRVMLDYSRIVLSI